MVLNETTSRLSQEYRDRNLELDKKIKDIDVLIDTLDKQHDDYNFAGLQKGFKTIYNQKHKEERVLLAGVRGCK